MACSCQKNKKQFEVVSSEGKVVFTSASKSTAETVAHRYPASKVREKAKPAPTTVK
ncbi:hypothetical protein [Streptomyces zaomyceticus]|uniref:hypothetical protein n=1 Tax=Streptomyces zaomyceticus TaxID=68286 RepID=UPI003794E418